MWTHEGKLFLQRQAKTTVVPPILTPSLPFPNLYFNTSCSRLLTFFDPIIDSPWTLSPAHTFQSKLALVINKPKMYSRARRAFAVTRGFDRYLSFHWLLAVYHMWWLQDNYRIQYYLAERNVLRKY